MNLKEQIANIKLDETIHLTFVTPEGRSVFSHENAALFANWWFVQCSKLSNLKEDFFIVLHKRETTPMRDENDVPIKKISSCFLQGDLAVPMRAEQSRKAFHSDAKTGKLLPRMTDHVFVDFELAEPEFF